MPGRSDSWGSHKGDFGLCKTCPAQNNFDWQWDIKDKGSHCAISLDPWTGEVLSHDRRWCDEHAAGESYRRFVPQSKLVTIYLNPKSLEPTLSKVSGQDAASGNRELTTIHVDRLPLGFKSKLRRTLTNKRPHVYVRRPTATSQAHDNQSQIISGDDHLRDSSTVTEPASTL